MKVKQLLRSNSGVSLVELLISISIMIVMLAPAYFSIITGFELFHKESTYQTVLADVHFYLDEMNSKIRLAGFRNYALIQDRATLESAGLIDVIPAGDVYVFKIDDTFYYLENSSLHKYNKPSNDAIVDHVVGFTVEEIVDGEDADKKFITLNITISVDGRQETISTSVYYRY